MQTEHKTQNPDRPKREAAFAILYGGHVRLLALMENGVLCMPIKKTSVYPEYPWKLACGGKDVAMFVTEEELAYYVLTKIKPDKVIFEVERIEYVAHRVDK